MPAPTSITLRRDNGRRRLARCSKSPAVVPEVVIGAKLRDGVDRNGSAAHVARSRTTRQRKARSGASGASVRSIALAAGSRLERQERRSGEAAGQRVLQEREPFALAHDEIRPPALELAS